MTLGFVSLWELGAAEFDILDARISFSMLSAVDHKLEFHSCICVLRMIGTLPGCASEKSTLSILMELGMAL
jgi:hypothetical protein